MEVEAKSGKVHLFILIISIVFVLRVFVAEGFVVIGDSMSPAILSGDYVFVNKLAYLFSEPERGDVVVARSRTGEKLLKRVMGLPNEWFDIDGKTTNVDPKEYFLVGDNKEVSIDSRVLGSVDDWDVAGKVFGVISFKRGKYLGF